jgi:hypothetical protein
MLRMSVLFFKIVGDFSKLGERGLEIFKFGRDNFGSGKIDAVFEGLKVRPLLHSRYGVFEPEDVEVDSALTVAAAALRVAPF